MTEAARPPVGLRGAAPQQGGRRYTRRYLFFYACAWAGATIAFQPFLSFLLPIRIGLLAHRSDPMLLSLAVVAGGVTAGIANLAWGALSDRSVWRGGSRRAWVVAGLIATLISYAVFSRVQSAWGLVGAIILFQLSFNLLLSSLAAMAAEEVPGRDKGLLGGVLSIGGPSGAAASVLGCCLASTWATRC